MSLEICQVSLKVAEQPGQWLFRDFSLTVGSGEFVALLGPSGSGKSSLLSYLCGVLDPYVFEAQGSVRLNSRELTHLPLEKRKIGILFQEDFLFPHLTVEENLTFALPARLTRKQKRNRIAETLEEVRLAGFEKHFPHMLSGGQKARISLLRALMSEPEAILLDEPFSKLDAELRSSFRAFTTRFITKLGIPTLLVTHDKTDLTGPIKHSVNLSAFQTAVSKQ